MDRSATFGLLGGMNGCRAVTLVGADTAQTTRYEQRFWESAPHSGQQPDHLEVPDIELTPLLSPLPSPERSQGARDVSVIGRPGPGVPGDGSL
jgi:hypothetical protein